MGAGGDAYLMVDPNATPDDDMSYFKYRHTTWNTKPDGTGDGFADIPAYKKESLKIYPEYRDTYYGELFLGKKKGEEGMKEHEAFMNRLHMNGNDVVLKHDSNVKIDGGVIKIGKKNAWSNNSDMGIYFWGSKHVGSDVTNGCRYTYYCLVPVNQVYDFQTNLERYISLREAFEHHSYCAQQWQDDERAVVVNTFRNTPIYAVRDNSTGKVYDAEWHEVDLQLENRRTVRKNLLHEQYPHTKNEAAMVSINEINAKTMLQRHSEDGFIIVSPCRGYSTFRLDPNMPGAKEILARENNKRIVQIIQQIKSSGYSYTPVYGGFIEDMGTENEQHVYERSFLIYNRKKNGEKGDMEELVRFGQKLADQYQQESFLVKAPGEKPKYITPDGDVDMEFSGNTVFNDFSQEYFTDLHKNSEKHNGNQSRKPTRFSYTESYVNPAPQCYSERHIRGLNGEIFVSDK